MTRDEIFGRIVAMIKEQMHVTDLEVTEETRLQDELGVDSIALMEFIINLEDEFQLDIPDEDVDDMTSMGEMLDYLDTRLHKNEN